MATLLTEFRVSDLSHSNNVRALHIVVCITVTYYILYLARRLYNLLKITLEFVTIYQQLDFSLGWSYACGCLYVDTR
jgi:hypothetical protein